MQRPLRGRTVIATALATLLVYLTGLTIIWNFNRAIAAENALMENLQAGALLAACVLLIPCLFRSLPTVNRFISWSMLLVLYSMLLREVDVEHLSESAAITALTSGLGRNVLLVAAFAGTFAFFMRRRNELISPLIQFCFSRVGLLIAIGCAFYVASLPFDKSMFDLTDHINLFCEEAVECAATFMFLVASSVHLAHFAIGIRSKPIEQPSPVPSSRMAA